MNKELFNKLKIAVIGDLIIDKYVVGDVKRISPEAPVPVVNVTDEYTVLGGAANVALNLTMLGINVKLYSKIGNDGAGKTATDMLNDNNVDIKHLIQEGNTITKTRIQTNLQQLCRVDRDYIHTPLIIEEQIFQQVDAVVISDYNKGLLNSKIVKQIQQACKKNNVFLAGDIKPVNAKGITNLTLLKPNRNEGMELLKEENIQNDKQLCEELFKKYQPQNLILTLGNKGMMGMNSNEFFSFPAQAPVVRNVSGAGDVVISVATACLTIGMTLKDTLQLATTIVGQTLQTPNTCVLNI
jgi:rfaE bifunctional protein kinase chain/domain